MATRKIKKGLFITLDGPEGCGKSTQAKALAAYLKQRGFSVILTRDPGGSPIAEEIRGLLLDRRYRGLSSFSEMLLYETSRASLVKEVILPALKKRKIVICDRFSDATRVYQGIAGGVPDRLIREVDGIICQGTQPDLTFILDVESRVGLRRLNRHRSFDRMESKPLRFHLAVRRGYRKIARREKGRVRWIPSMTLDKVRNKIIQEVEHVLQRHFGKTGRR